MTGSAPAVRVAIALTAIVTAALLPALSVVVQLAQSPARYRPPEDAVAALERRAGALRAALGDERVVGYLAPEAPADAAQRTARLYVIRYALAPVTVLDDTDQALVVADALTDRNRLPTGLAVRRDFGNGLLLLERSAERRP